MTFEEFKDSLKKDFKGTGFILETDVPLLAGTWNKYKADLVITNAENPEKSNLAVLVSTSDDKVNVSYAKKVVGQMVSEYGYWIGLVWNKGTLWILDPAKSGSPLKKWSVRKDVEDIRDIFFKANEFLGSEIDEDYASGLIAALNSLIESNNGSNIEKETATIIRDWLQEELRELKKSKGDSRDLFQQESRLVSVSLQRQFQLLTRLLKADEKKVTYRFSRYISMKGLQRILESKKEGMCGLAGMNDRSEGFFLDRCLNNASINLFRKPQRMIDQYNEAFILSLCSEAKKDDLTMWRLYGSDGAGICMVYEVDKEAIRNSQEFILLPISYGNSSNRMVLLFKILAKLPYVKGLKFRLSYKYVWQYFVKSDDFKIEDEYRLLYIPSDITKAKVKWILNDTYSIFHPLCEFDSPIFAKAKPVAKANIPVNANDEDNPESNAGDKAETNTGNGSDFPLRLTEIILGPKCPESKVNKVQLRTRLKSCVPSITITESRIDVYR